MKKTEKIFFVQNLTARLAPAKSLIFTDITGLKVPQQEKLRQMLREVGGKLLVVKNTLLGRAIKNSKLKPQSSKLKKALSGQTALIISEEDELAPLQALGRFIREFELPKLKIGIIGGKLQDEVTLLKLSYLPTREVLLGQLVGVLSGPMSGVVETLRGNMGRLVYILNERAKA